MNRSEQLFDEACRRRRYIVEEIPRADSRTPDRRVTLDADSVIFEIKELTPSDADRRELKELQSKGWTLRGGTPGRRVRSEIQAAAPQLRTHSGQGLPTAILLFDNIVVDGDRPGAPNVDLEPWQIDYGMYGLQTANLEMPSGRWLGDGRGGKRQMTEKQRRYISAVCVLYEEISAVWVYHNFFATVPFPRTMFSRKEDRHFVKPTHPNSSPQEWKCVWPAV